MQKSIRLIVTLQVEEMQPQVMSLGRDNQGLPTYEQFSALLRQATWKMTPDVIDKLYSMLMTAECQDYFNARGWIALSYQGFYVSIREVFIGQESQ